MDGCGALQRSMESGWRKDEAEVHPVFIRVAALRKRRASQAVAKTIDHRIGYGPNMAQGDTLRVIPRRQRRRVGQTLNVVTRDTAIGREIGRSRYQIALVVTA